MMDFTGPGSWRWTLVCLVGLSSLITAQSCQGNQIVDTFSRIGEVFNKCPTYTGNVTFQNIRLPAGSSSSPEIYLHGLQTLQGSLYFINLFDDSPGTSFDFASLQSVSGQLSFSDLHDALIPGFPSLTSIGGFAFKNVTFSLDSGASPPVFGWNNTDGFTVESQYQFPKLQTIQSLSLVGCGNLAAVGPFGPVYGTAGWAESPSVRVSSNQQLSSLTLNGYGDIHTNVIVTDNNRSLTVSTDMTNGFLQIGQVAELRAEELSLLNVPDAEGFLGAQFITDNGFDTLSLPALSSIEDTQLQIDRNINLSNLSLPLLQHVSGLEIDDNTQLKNVDLSSVIAVDNLEIAGPVNSIDLAGLTSSNQITGQVTITPDNVSVCKNFTLPNGKYTCELQQQTHAPSDPSRTGQPGHSSQPSGGLSQDAKIGIGVGVGVGGLLILSAIVFICSARRRKQRQRISPRSAGADEYYMEPKNHERPPARYTKVAHSSSVDHGSADHSSEDKVSPSSHFAENNIADTRFGESRFGENWSPPEQRVPNPDGRVELEEQQGTRHEMDARSLQDMDLDDDREETRSLEDIERAHGQT